MKKELKRGIGDVSKWIDFIKVAVENFKTSGDLSSGALLQKYQDKFAQMAADVVAASGDGFNFADLVLLAKLVPEIMGIAKDIESADGAAKKQFVIDAIWLIYHSVDAGPDGKQNRIKIPFLGWLSYLGISAPEEQVERFILKVAVEFAIEAAYPYLKEKGTV